MQHLSSESLVALALGDGDEGRDHLSTCAQCRGEVEGLRGTAERFRAADVAPMAPPAAVWERIAAEIAVEADAPVGASAAPDGGTSAAPADRTGARPASGHVAPRRRRRFGLGALLAASAASAVAAAAIAVLVVVQLGAAPRSVDVANAVLEPLASSVSVDPARAEVIEQDGQRLLVVDTDALPDVDGYLDVWLLDEQAQQMVSLGVLDARRTQLALPPDLDLATFPIVDVSIEPYDGDPTHSGNSIWRGALES
ncbi:anti-sigma factor [Agrococcus carbonis]|uniref:Anti-sigma-K factor rskA n=1 Tax=Agrococcus carbonis TaxID=684552 RepID=A0A1H1RRN0_9MICO|nr:anti-sigma factor [Agrococcus carbonis]SDS38314.1 Anti-sigma-K factor rskA [Agrococcus carbonis]